MNTSTKPLRKVIGKKATRKNNGKANIVLTNRLAILATSKVSMAPIMISNRMVNNMTGKKMIITGVTVIVQTKRTANPTIQVMITSEKRVFSRRKPW